MGRPLARNRTVLETRPTRAKEVTLAEDNYHVRRDPTAYMNVTQAVVAREREWILDRSDRTVSLINELRDDLGAEYGADVGHVTSAEYTDEVDAVFADGDLAVNVAGLVALLRDLEVHADYAGFVVDELLGRELTCMLSGETPFRVIGESTFHYADRYVRDGAAGLDDLDAALAAGFQTRLPGWEWTDRESPFRLG